MKRRRRLDASLQGWLHERIKRPDGRLTARCVQISQPPTTPNVDAVTCPACIKMKERLG